jgi:hypothetical protein
MFMSTAFTLPSRLLAKTCRPSAKEVESYAQAIEEAGGERPASAELLMQEAELQLWVWRTENRQRTARKRRATAT